VLSGLQIAAQREAVRALAYALRLMPSVVTENHVANLGSPKLVVLPSPQALTESAWQMLLEYVRQGGNLLVTGPVSRDEHMQTVDRLSALHLDGKTTPLLSRQAQIRLENAAINLSFDQQKQAALEILRFADAVNLHQTSVGTGSVYWAAYPVELSEDPESTARLYAYVAGKAGLVPAFESHSPLPSGVLAAATEFDDSVLYIFESEFPLNCPVELRDRATGVDLRGTVPALRASLALIDKKTKTVVAKYDF
jgi:hypothetical protein